MSKAYANFNAIKHINDEIHRVVCLSSQTFQFHVAIVLFLEIFHVSFIYDNIHNSACVERLLKCLDRKFYWFTILVE